MRKITFFFAYLTLVVPCQAGIIYVDANTPDNNDGSSWAYAYKYLQDALADANSTGDVWGFTTIASDDIIYVDKNAAGGNGSSWDDAFTSIQDAIDLAVTGSEIWVAKGTYTPASELVVRKEISLYGGFDTTEAQRSQRDWKENTTTIDGNNNIRCFKVVDYFCTIDGFTIANGRIGPDGTGSGGGMYIDDAGPDIVNCTFYNNFATNRGGAVGLGAFPTTSTFTNCTFRDNQCGPGLEGDHDGGAVGLYATYAIFIDCRFYNNYASRRGGGIGLSSSSCDLTLINCILEGNSTRTSDGGGVYGSSGQISLVNCTFANNTAEGEEGGGIRLISGGNTSITNCIFWGNEDDGGNDESAQIHYSGTMPAVDYSCIQGLTELEGTGNTGENPDFTDGLRLATNSPCIDAGDNNSVSADTTDLDNDGNTVEPIPYDLNGFPRFIDDCRAVDTGNGTAPIVDMGAYEFLNSDIDSKGNVDFVDFCLFAAHWMDTNCGTCSGADLTCDGNVDEDDLRELVAYWLAGVP